jgi:ribose transport system ATP-binding protein
MDGGDRRMKLELRGIKKSFGGVVALRGVDFQVAPGEIVGLVGGNGAGKSTLMKVAAGIHRPDEGTVTIGTSSPSSPAEAIALGVSLVRQELIQAMDLDVGANVLLGHEPARFGVIDRKELYRRAAIALDRVGGGIDPRAPLRSLSPGQRQRVEIARALSLDARILLLDEPTATLTEGDATRLFDLLRDLRAQGLGLVYISHRLGEILAITDRVVCLRDGVQVVEFATAAATRDTIVEFLAGAAMTGAEAPAPARPDVVLSVRGRVSFDLHAGEILGLAGLVGAGRTSVLRELFGAQWREGGERLQITMHGQPVTIDSPRAAIQAGLALVPEERGSQGLILDMLVERNIALPSLARFRLEDEDAIARPFMNRFSIRGGGPASMLSGGNQQKIVLAKWMARDPAVLLLDEPTRGLDIRAKRDVHDVVRELAAAGKGVIVSSSEAEEIGTLCHRALVLSRGKVAGELARQELTDANILRLAV